MMPAKRRILPALLSIALSLAACGAGSGPAHPSDPRPASESWRDSDRSTVLVEATVLWPMDVLWDRVTIHADGRGDVGDWEGELSYIRHFPFRLSGREVGQVRQLLAHLPPPEGVPANPLRSAGTLVYTIVAGGRTVRVLDGPMPRSLAELTAFVRGLIDRSI